MYGMWGLNIKREVEKSLFFFSTIFGSSIFMKLGSSSGTRDVLVAINQALEVSVQNVPKFDGETGGFFYFQIFFKSIFEFISITLPFLTKLYFCIGRK